MPPRRSRRSGTGSSAGPDRALEDGVRLAIDATSEESRRVRSGRTNEAVVVSFAYGTRDDEMFVAAMGQLLDSGYYRRFFNTVRGVWVEHPTLLAYIESREVYTGLASDVVAVGVRLRVQGPRGEQVYRELARALW